MWPTCQHRLLCMATATTNYFPIKAFGIALLMPAFIVCEIRSRARKRLYCVIYILRLEKKTTPHLCCTVEAHIDFRNVKRKEEQKKNEKQNDQNEKKEEKRKDDIEKGKDRYMTYLRHAGP